MRLTGKVAIVTGAGSGIGRACAVALAREGATLVLSGRRRERLDEVARQCGGEPLVVPGDITEIDVIHQITAAALDRFGAIHVLLNNAGAMVPGTAESLTDEDYDRMFDLNVRAVWRMSRAVLGPMRKAGGGSIINISSVLGSVGAPNRTLYAATKGAVTQLTRCMAVDHAPDRIRVNCICPSFVETELTSAYIDKLPDPTAAREQRRAHHPIGRLGRPEDIGGMAVYLASDEASWVTGAAMMVDGGYTAV